VRSALMRAASLTCDRTWTPRLRLCEVPRIEPHSAAGFLSVSAPHGVGEGMPLLRIMSVLWALRNPGSQPTYSLSVSGA
jgi:hypothetical protein